MDKRLEGYELGGVHFEIAKSEAFLVYDLVKSLNCGNVGKTEDRVNIAKAQLKQLEELGFDLRFLYRDLLSK